MSRICQKESPLLVLVGGFGLIFFDREEGFDRCQSTTNPAGLHLARQCPPKSLPECFALPDFAGPERKNSYQGLGRFLTRTLVLLKCC